MPKLQSPSAVIMIRPHAFHSNPETCVDNSFQKAKTINGAKEARHALQEFDDAAAQLRRAGVTVHVFDDQGERDTPDSVFPNNWFSTHAGGHVAIYPMFAPNRRRERRSDVIDFLKSAYRVQDVIDYSGLEGDNLALEGTGAMVLDHIGRLAYTVKSNRADPLLLERFCTNFNFEPIVFEARDRSGVSVYHTNVLMTVATEFALICLDMVVERDRREMIVERLEETGRDVIALTHDQIDNFAGNALELETADGRILALSSRAYDSLTEDQIARISTCARPTPLSIPTIETAGGSIRCMLAGVHLAPRKATAFAPEGDLT